MANRIKGITIEIGGDVTKLDKALAGTEKNIKKTQTALKDVERLLKLDPGNTELLEQKQRLLAAAVSETSEKLETLRDAAKDADEKLAKGADYAKAFAPLAKPLEEAQAAFDKLKDKKKEMDAAFETGAIDAAEYEAFNKKLSETRDRLGELTKQKRALDKQFEGRMDTDQYDALQREIIETEEQLKDLEKAAERSSVAIGKIEAAAGKAANGAKKVADATRGVSTAAAGILTGALATVPATEELRGDLAKLDNAAKNAGVSTEAVRDAWRQLVAVTGEEDSAVEALANLLQAGVKENNLQKAIDGVTGAYLLLPDTVKIESLADSLQETLATGEATGQFAEVLGRLGIATEDFDLMLQSVPGSAGDLNNALETLAQNGLNDLTEAYRADNAEMLAAEASQIRLKEQMAELAETILPLITMVTDLAATFMEWFNGLGSGSQKGVFAMAAIVAAISPAMSTISQLLFTIKEIGPAFELVKTTVGPIISGLSLNPWVAGITAVIAALVLLVTHWEDVKKVVGNVIDSVVGYIQKAVQAVKDFFSAVDRGGGRTGSSGGGGSYTPLPSGGGGRSVATAAMAAGVPALASGGVFAPNSPMLAVLGDNRTEREIAAPDSALQENFLAALGRVGMLGGGKQTQVNVRFTGSLAQLAHILKPEIDAETVRLGPSLLGN